MKDMPFSERPYERFESVGVENLSDSELLAIILRSGTKDEKIIDISKRIISIDKEVGIEILTTISLDDLLKIKGIGKVKAIQLMTIAEIAKRIYKEKRKKYIKYDCPETIANYYQAVYKGYKKECLRMLLLDGGLNFISDEIIGDGQVSSAYTSPTDIFKLAIQKQACNIILVHNHPSQNVGPSSIDLEFTKHLVYCGKIMGIPILDHIIITNYEYFSIKKEFNNIFE